MDSTILTEQRAAAASATARRAPPRALAGEPIGEILVAQGAITADKLAEALAVQADKGGRLGEVLISLKACSEEQVLKALAGQPELPSQMRLSGDEVSPELINLVPINFAKQARLLALRREGDAADPSVVVAVADPLDTSTLDGVRLLLGARVQPLLVPSQSILDCINSVYDRAKNEAEQLVDDLEADNLDTVAHEREEPQALRASSDEAPIIRLVNSLLFRAAKERASDIHIEPQERDICVRFRVDGVLQEVIRPPKRFQNSIVSRVKISAIEDPVEYQLAGISQTPVNPKIELTFANGLRSFLRQDPDVIMVGEIRDVETAEIAIQASLTGHLVFSTVHTNDAAGAITRLVDMGVEPFLVASSLMGCMAQRLVRVLCKECREAYLPTPEELKEVGLAPKDVREATGGMIYRAV